MTAPAVFKHICFCEVCLETWCFGLYFSVPFTPEGGPVSRVWCRGSGLSCQVANPWGICHQCVGPGIVKTVEPYSRRVLSLFIPSFLEEGSIGGCSTKRP